MGDEISIKVKTLDGQSRDVKVSKNATVMDLKARIEQLTKMPKNRQRIIYQGRVLQDSMKLDSDNGKMDGSAVHVVESAPPGSGSSGSGSNSRPSTSSASRTQERLINGETIQSRDFQRRHRHERTSNYRENQVRRQVNRMEEFLNNLNASITALENGTSPEQSQQYLQNNSAESNFPESGAIQVRDLASFVGRLADGIQRFPPRLREIEAFMSADRPLQTRDSEEYARARSLIQNAMDAVRHLSHLTQIFSSLVIPLGDEPPRNLNIINTRPHQTLSNFIIPSLQEAGVTPSNFGPGLIFGPFTAPESMTGATASQVFPDLATAAEESVVNDLNPQATTVIQPTRGQTGSNSRPATARVQDSRRSGTNPRPQYRFATSILTHSLRPERPQTASNGQNRDGINASINVQANITPNITIRIEAPNSRTDQNQTDETNNQVGSEPEVVADNTPGLSRDILQQITNSVTRLSETGEALIIENEGPTNGDLGRVVGEAVAQTLSQLSRQTQSQNTSSFSSNSNIPNGRSSTSASTTTSTTTQTSSGTSTKTDRYKPVKDPRSGGTSSSSSQNDRFRNMFRGKLDRKRKVGSEKRKDLLEIFKPDQLKIPIIEYLFGPDWMWSDQTKNEQTETDKFIYQVGEKFNELILQDFINIFNGDPASAKMTKVFEIIEKLDFLPRAASSFFANLFTKESPKPDCDIVESNLSLLRHFLRDLKNNLSDPAKLGAFVVQFINLWIGLNCDILRGGQAKFERCLKRKMKNSHLSVEKYLSEFVTWSKSQLSPFSIDGYVMSEKIDVAEQQETETSVPESSLSCSDLQSKGSKDDSDTTHITTHANIPTANGDPETNENDEKYKLIMSGWADTSTSAAIQSEICRFESVHPNIYAVYELLQLIDNSKLQNQIREHIINIEDSFVNSQEWTISRRVLELRVAVIGGLRSGKSALVHRYLTGSYVNDESPEGGRFKKEVNVEGESHLLLIRDEAGHPDVSLCSWADGVLLVFSLADEESFRLVHEYSRRFIHLRPNLPLLLIGTQDSLGTRSPRVIDDSRARKLAIDLNGEYIETCATYGMNIDKVFSDAALKILKSKNSLNGSTFAQPQTTATANNSSLGSSRMNKLSTTPLRNQGFSSSQRSGASSLAPPINDHGAESSDGSSGIQNISHRKPPRRKSAKHGLFSRKSGEKSNNQSNHAKNGSSAQMIKKGYVQKKSRTSLRDFKKKFLTLSEDGVLAYFQSESDFLDDRDRKSVDVGRTSIKVPGRGGQPSSQSDNEFTVVSSVTGDHWIFNCDSADQRDEWVECIERMIKNSLSIGSLAESIESRSITSTGSQPNFDRPGNKSCAGTVTQPTTPSVILGLFELRLVTLKLDCHMPNPVWASLNLGILICIECSGIHRNLGAHVSRVRSVELDEWSPEHKAMLQAIGNNLSNSVYEANIGTRVKPCPNSDRMEKENWIKEKYVHKTFISSIDVENSPSNICDAVNRHDISLLIRLLAFSTQNELNEGSGSRSDTPLHVAAFKGDLVSLQLLLWSRASARVLNINNQSPIDIAAQRGHHIAVRLLHGQED